MHKKVNTINFYLGDFLGAFPKKIGISKEMLQAQL